MVALGCCLTVCVCLCGIYDMPETSRSEGSQRVTVLNNAGALNCLTLLHCGRAMEISVYIITSRFIHDCLHIKYVSEPGEKKRCHYTPLPPPTLLVLTKNKFLKRKMLHFNSDHFNMTLNGEMVSLIKPISCLSCGKLQYLLFQA